MAETYFPFDAGAGAAITEDQWRQMWDPILGPGGVLRGQLNSLVVSANGSGMQVFVATGQAWVKGAFYQNDAPIALAIAANGSANPRIDRVVLRSDFVANTIHAVVKPGVAAVAPVPPALEQSGAAWDIPLAQVLVDPGAVSIVAGRVTDERQYAGPAGGLDIDADTLGGHAAAFFATATGLTAETNTRVAADTAHEAAGNPHPGYATDADLAGHTGAADPHPGYALDGDLANEATARINEDKKRPRVIGVGGTVVGGAPGLGVDFMVQGGDNVYAVSAANQLRLDFPTPFPNGVIAVVMISGDENAYAGTFTLQDGVNAVDHVFFKVTIGSTFVRGIWIAIGW